MQKLIVAVVMAAGLSRANAAESRELACAREHFRQGDFPGAIKALEAAGALDAEGLLLAGQAYYREGKIREACGFLERAVAANPAASRYVHWLGRA